MLQDMAGHLIRRLHQQSAHLFQRCMEEAGADLTPVQFAAMQALKARPGIDQAQVAAAIAYDRATIGGVVDRLEQKGYVSRVVSSRDRRAREVRLTDDGLRVLDEIHPLVVSLQDAILGGLSRSERRQFLALARKAIAGDDG